MARGDWGRNVFATVGRSCMGVDGDIIHGYPRNIAAPNYLLIRHVMVHTSLTNSMPYWVVRRTR